MRLRSRKREAPDFSLATVNVVFLLLLFFLAVGTVVNPDKIDVPLPTTSDLPLDRLPYPLLVIGGDGALALNGQPIAERDLQGAATALQDDDERTPDYLNILAPADARASVAMSVAARLATEGVAVRLVTIRESR